MLKRRVIFVLLFDHSSFMLSRNFRLQRVGDIEWLIKNYDFATTATFLDEIVLLNVQRDSVISSNFLSHLKQLNDFCFVPITAGGGIRSVDDAALLLRNGADKVLVNQVAVSQPEVVTEIAETFGSQCVTLGIDFKRFNGEFRAFTNCGQEMVGESLDQHLARLAELPAGEWFLNSIDRDGTGQGFDVEVLEAIPPTLCNPLILSGGASKAAHFLSVMTDSRVNALATAHLFNFVGDGLQLARQALIGAGIDLPSWSHMDIRRLKGVVSDT